MRKLIWGITCLFCISLSACQPIVRPTDAVSPLGAPAIVEIPFETIYQYAGQYIFQQPELALFVITSSAELDTLLERLGPYHTGFAEEIGAIDYTKEIVLMAYHGRAPTNAYRIMIQELSYQNDTVNVVIQITGKGKPADAEESYPVHVVRVKREFLPHQEKLYFRVWHEANVVLEREFTIKPA